MFLLASATTGFFIKYTFELDDLSLFTIIALFNVVFSRRDDDRRIHYVRLWFNAAIVGLDQELLGAFDDALGFVLETHQV